jgi:hypothetical protein
MRLDIGLILRDAALAAPQDEEKQTSATENLIVSTNPQGNPHV